MDFNKLSMGAKLALVGGAILVVNLFMPWYSIDLGIVSASLNAFDAEFFAWGGSLIAIAGAVVLVLKEIGKKTVNAGQFKTEQLALILGAIGLILIILRFVTESEFAGFGLYLGIIGAALVTYGAFRATKEAGLNLPGMGGGGSGTGGGGGTGTGN